MKRIKMLLYGDPGVGKSVFASKAPRPFFITTDGNYEWLEDFGADPNAHKQVADWTEAKEVFAGNFDGYDTIVVDLLEDLFKWCESEFCVKSRIDHVSDIGYGKGYEITRNEFFLEVSKLLAKDKHVILITHGITFVTKDRRGVEHTRYAPSSRIPDKVLDMIEGRIRYCLRCYTKAEEQTDGTIIKKRYLSLIPKENEFGIIRGVDENKMPQDIPLEFDEFTKAIGLYGAIQEKLKNPPPVTEKKEEPVEEQPRRRRRRSEPEPEITQVEEARIDLSSHPDAMQPASVEPTVVEPLPSTATAEVPATDEKKDEVPWATDTPRETTPAVEEKKPQTNAEKIAAIKAKIAAINASKS